MHLTHTRTIASMKDRDRVVRGRVEPMKRKGRKNQGQASEGQNPLLVDAEAFTDVIRKMVNTSPMPLKEMPRRKNPHCEPILRSMEKD
jgi:hypothetical protein